MSPRSHFSTDFFCSAMIQCQMLFFGYLYCRFELSNLLLLNGDRSGLAVECAQMAFGRNIGNKVDNFCYLYSLLENFEMNFRFTRYVFPRIKVYF